MLGTVLDTGALTVDERRVPCVRGAYYPVARCAPGQ